MYGRVIVGRVGICSLSIRVRRLCSTDSDSTRALSSGTVLGRFHLQRIPR